MEEVKIEFKDNKSVALFGNNEIGVCEFKAVSYTHLITGFLPFNANPAKTFMGDVGSQFLGFSLAVISMFGIAKTVTLVVLIAPVLVLGLPIFDTLFAIIRRIKKGKSLKAVFQPDKGHLHHRLIARGYTCLLYTSRCV